MNSPVYRMAIIGLMIAVYVVLARMSIVIINWKITMKWLPVVVMAMLFGPVNAAVVGGVGEFISQLIGYGLMVTTPLWLIAPMVYGLVAGFGCNWLHKQHFSKPGMKQILFFVILIVASLLTTLTNTVCIALDAVIGGYYKPAIVFGQLAVRIATGIVTAVVVGIINIPLMKALCRVVPGSRDLFSKE
ncbi:MAG: ECF transporter S component [Clostridia bacterium]|nr:ECF transporter S component [Clostridia bacterium]